MTAYIQRCLIASANYAKPARDLCAGVTPGESGMGMFLTGGRSPSGELPATHYINEGMLEDVFANLLPLTTFDAQGNATTEQGKAPVIVALAQSKGIPVTLAQIEAVLSGVQVTQETPQQAMTRLGLQTIRGELP